MIGSGRYTVEQYEPGQQTVLQANERVQGRGPGADQHGDHPVLRQGLGAEAGGRVGRRRRRLPQPLADRPRGPGGRRRRQRRPGRGRGDPLPQLQPRSAARRRRRAEAGDPPGGGADDRPPVDRRQRLQRHGQAAVLDDPGQPPVPHRGVQGRLRRGPDVDAATQTLDDAGVKTPVPLEVWWTPSHYGPSSGDEYAEIKRQLDESGLFDVTLKSTEWNQYSEAAFTDKYPPYPARLVPGLSGSRRLRRQLPVQHQLPEHPLRQPGDPEAAGRGEGVDR